MIKYKKLKLITKNKIIFISLIISMSIVGVGYANWLDSTTINLSLKTGYTSKKIITDYNGSINTIFDGETLYVSGEIYPDYEGSIKVNITDDSGSIPSKITNISPRDNKIDEISDDMNSFEIIINPSLITNEIELMQSSNLEDTIDNSELSSEINIISSEINDYYNKTGEYSFYYTITYKLENGNWEKNILIVGNIKVVPDQKKLDEMNQYLQLKIEEQKVLEEQQRILLEQQELEELKQKQLDTLNNTNNEIINNGINDVDGINQETSTDSLINEIDDNENNQNVKFEEIINPILDSDNNIDNDIHDNNTIEDQIEQLSTDNLINEIDDNENNKDINPILDTNNNIDNDIHVSDAIEDQVEQPSTDYDASNIDDQLISNNEESKE